MEEFESYFENLNFHFNSWHDILENENIDIRNNGGGGSGNSSSSSSNCEMNNQNVQLLPREDVSLYGIIPKMERRSFSLCKECKLVFNPKDILSHKNCSLKIKSPHVTHFKKKVKTKKKSPLPLPPLFPTGQEDATMAAQQQQQQPHLDELNTTKLRPNTMYVVYANELQQIDAIANPTSAKPTPMIEDVRDIPLPSLSAPNSTAESAAAAVANTASVAVGDSDKHSTSYSSLSSSSSITSSSSSHSNLNNSSEPSKRKKHVNNSSKKPDTNNAVAVSTATTTTTGHNNQCGVVAEDTRGPCTRSIKSYSNHSSENESFPRNKKRDGYFSENISQEIPVSVPIVYLSMSPVSGIPPLQVTQEGDFVCVESTPPQVTEYPHQVYFSIPYQMNVKMYKTKPKPCSVPLYGARKMGGAIVISKQKLLNQRKDILSAINSSCSRESNDDACGGGGGCSDDDDGGALLASDLDGVDFGDDSQLKF